MSVQCFQGTTEDVLALSVPTHLRKVFAIDVDVFVAAPRHVDDIDLARIRRRAPDGLGVAPQAAVGHDGTQTINMGDSQTNGAVLEKIVKKLRGGVMPPIGMPRPEPAAYLALRQSIEHQLDDAAAKQPNPGRTEGLHRLNRVEYAGALHDPLAALVGAFVIASWSYGLIRDSAMVLLDADSNPTRSRAIKEMIERDMGARVADLHLWQLLQIILIGQPELRFSAGREKPKPEPLEGRPEGSECG